MRAIKTVFTKSIKQKAAIPTNWIKDLRVTSNFYSLKHNVTQSILSLTRFKNTCYLLIEIRKLFPTKQ